MPQDSIGWLHTIAAIIALITGSLILAQRKGTKLHRYTGRIYGIAMLFVCTTSFMIFRVHQTFGILHFFAIISTVTLGLGMLPLYTSFFKNPIISHLAWMYWSVIGLYCAFAAELFTRLPMIFEIEDSFVFFYTMIGISTGFVGMIGSRYFKKHKQRWEQQFGKIKSA